MSDWVRAIVRNPFAVLASALLMIVSLAAIIAPVITQHDPTTMAIVNRLQGPSSSYWLGTDDFGRDLFSRMVYGARLSLEISAWTMILTVLAGTLVGLAAASDTRLDNIMMRVMDALMAFPAILLAVAVMAALGAASSNVILTLSVVFVPGMARVVRGTALSVRATDFVLAARAIGVPGRRIAVAHILPNCFSPLIIQATYVFAQAILAEAGLSFLGVGAPPPTPSWGNILSDGRERLAIAPWVTIFPGLAISLTVLAVNIVGDTVRDAFDPRLRRLAASRSK